MSESNSTFDRPVLDDWHGDDIALLAELVRGGGLLANVECISAKGQAAERLRAARLVWLGFNDADLSVMSVSFRRRRRGEGEWWPL